MLNREDDALTPSKYTQKESHLANNIYAPEGGPTDGNRSIRRSPRTSGAEGNLPGVVARTQTVYGHQACVRTKCPEDGPRLARRTVNLCPREKSDEGERRKLPDSNSREMTKLPIKSNRRRTQTSGQFLLSTATSELTKPAFWSESFPTARRPGVRWECTVCTQSAQETSVQ